MKTRELRKYFDSIYLKWNQKEYIYTDPLTTLFNYNSNSDIEIIGLISSSLAYGRVSQILKAIKIVSDQMGSFPTLYLKSQTSSDIINDFKDFKYRFTKGKDISNLLIGIKYAIQEYDSLENLFLSNYNKGKDITIAMETFVQKLLDYSQSNSNYLIPKPSKGSACKRLSLYIRWMVRKDEIDLGIWSKISQKDILIPLDTHMFNISKKFGFTNRKSADLKTVIEITENFRKINKEDPIKYDFSLTRFGIMNLGTLSPSSAINFSGK